MYLGIDLGTSAVKLCVIDADGNLIAQGSKDLPISHPFDGASEQNCEDWWEATRACIKALDPALRVAIKAIGLSGQMHGAVVLDAQHKPVRPVILWNDARADVECSDIIAADPSAAQRAGVLPMPGFTAPKILWLSRHEPEAHARIRHVMLPKDYIGLCLHGGCVTDPSDAAGTSWFDEAARYWSARLCELTATEPAWLPCVMHGTDVAGTLLPDIATDLGLTPDIPVAAGAGDGAAGAVGLGAVQAGDGFISLGTSGQLFVTTDAYRPNIENRIHAYAHTVPAHWFQMAAMLNGARPMAWLADLLNRPIDHLLAEAAEARPGPLFLPYLTGERTPHGDTTIRGGFANLGEGMSQGSLMRAVLEAIAFSFADAAEAFAKAGTAPTSLLAIGGGTRSDLLMQMIADVTGITLGRSDEAVVGPALGAARLALVACGDKPMDAVMQRPTVRHWFKPKGAIDHSTQIRLEAYRALYPALRTVQQKLR